MPCSSLFKTVTVRCGHCDNLLSVNLRGLLLPTAAAATNQLPFGGGQQQALLSPTSPHGLLVCCFASFFFFFFFFTVSVRLYEYVCTDCVRTNNNIIFLQDEMMPFQQALSLPTAEPASACVSTITSINNSCGGGNNAPVMSSMAPPPQVKPAPQEPQLLPKSTASGNKCEC